MDMSQRAFCCVTLKIIVLNRSVYWKRCKKKLLNSLPIVSSNNKYTKVNRMLLSSYKAFQKSWMILHKRFYVSDKNKIGIAHVELQSRFDLVCRILLEKQ